LATTQAGRLQITSREKTEDYANSGRAEPTLKTCIRAGDPVLFGYRSIRVVRNKRQYLLLADEDLISLADGGNVQAFAALYDRHARAAYSLAYRMMGERQAAEDLVQEAFLNVWRAAGSYRVQRASVRTWILSIVNNRGIDGLRSAASHRRTQDRVEAQAPAAQPSEAFTETWRNSQREQVREALRGLPPEQLKVLELAYFSGYTHTEIAEVLGLPLGTVKGRMRLGLKKIREYFDSRGMAVPG
jgi:RNA polymerase sigma-70 factor (ECF subfamily)